MIFPTPFTTFLPLLISLTTALPAILPHPLHARDTSLAAEQTWHIPRLDMHMMSTSTGIPGNGPWPEGSKFDSTIDFDVLVPEEAPLPASKWNCKGTMKNGTIIEDVVSCVDGKGGVGDVSFGMTEYEAVGERRAELSFWLWVYRVGEGSDGRATILNGATAITANDPQEPTSYLTCLLGRPFDGLRCQIGSYLSVRKELVVEGSEVR
ncbi:hypothetical protein J4E81_010211 [Alternaria sp. BMP 2799]|nr:hypothetical protein J4E81_010211 [Alternaria sp. BMP 2799]